MKINAVNVSLDDSSGAGKFVGSQSHSLSGSLDFSSTTSFEIPNTLPSLPSASGDICLKEDELSCDKVIAISDGVDELYCMAAKPGNLTTNDGDVVMYDIATQSFKTAPEPVFPAEFPSKVSNVQSASKSSSVNTRFNTFINTGLSISYTPKSAAAILLIEVSGETGSSYSALAASSNRMSEFKLIREVSNPGDVGIFRSGWDMGGTASGTSEGFGQATCFEIAFIDPAVSVDTRSYTLQIRSIAASGTIKSNLRAGGLGGGFGNHPAFIHVYELIP